MKDQWRSSMPNSRGLQTFSQKAKKKKKKKNAIWANMRKIVYFRRDISYSIIIYDVRFKTTLLYAISIKVASKGGLGVLPTKLGWLKDVA